MKFIDKRVVDEITTSTTINEDMDSINSSSIQSVQLEKVCESGGASLHESKIMRNFVHRILYMHRKRTRHHL